MENVGTFSTVRDQLLTGLLLQIHPSETLKEKQRKPQGLSRPPTFQIDISYLSKHDQDGCILQRWFPE